jgi:hypothetical protein
VLLRDPDHPEESKRIHLDGAPEEQDTRGEASLADGAAPVARDTRPPCLRWDSRKCDPDPQQQKAVSGAMDDDSLLVVKGFRPGNITADDFIDQVLRIIGDPRDPQSKTSSRFERVVFDDVTQLHQRFPILDKTRLFIPTLIDMFKAHGITSLFIADVDDFEVSKYNEVVRNQDHGLGVIADQVIRTKLETQQEGSSSTSADASAPTSPRTEAKLIVEARAKPAEDRQRPHEIRFGNRAGVVTVELVLPADKSEDPQPGDRQDVSRST